jgi:hypothetical protein
VSVDLYLQLIDGTDHPTYWFDMAGPRDLLRIIDQLPTESRLNEVGGGDVWAGAEPVWRPTDYKAFRTQLLAAIDYNHDQFNELCDVLENEPDYWLYFSV